MNCYREPTLNGLLSDPIVRAVMEADGVNPVELEGLLRQVAQRLRIPRGQHQPGLTRSPDPIFRNARSAKPTNVGHALTATLCSRSLGKRCQGTSRSRVTACSR
jgi:hypothetical protein